jgi:hypothetical protein
LLPSYAHASWAIILKSLILTGENNGAVISD